MSQENLIDDENRVSLADPESATEVFTFFAGKFLYGLYLYDDEDWDESEVAEAVFQVAVLLDEENNASILPEGYTLAATAKRLRPAFVRRLHTLGFAGDSLEEENQTIVALAINEFFEELVGKFAEWVDVDDDEDLPEIDEAMILKFLTEEETQRWINECVCYLLAFK